jgi:hypothetical protein
MSRFIVIAAGLSFIAAAPAYAAPKAAAPFPMAADGTTNIADCAKADVKFKNECISKSRPVSGRELYAKETASKAVGAATAAVKAVTEKVAKVAKPEKVKTPAPAAVIGAPKGFKINKDGTTNIADCGKARADVRDQCISRSRPLNTKELAKYTKMQTLAHNAQMAKLAVKQAATKASDKVKAAATAVVAPVKSAASAAVANVKSAAAAAVASVDKGFVVAKDGTTDINSCGKAKPEYRNECISRSRPVTGAEIYGKGKAKS